MHFPYCRSKCAYCAFTSSPDFSTQSKYIERLKTEIAQTSNKPKINTIYFGGGTPSVMERGYLAQIKQTIDRYFDTSEVVEFTVECNPDSVDEEFLRECKDMGVTRISVGLQSASDECLKAIGRAHDVSKFISAVKSIKKYFDNISSDIILGLPNEKEGDIEKAVELFCELGITHISSYALTVEEGTPLKASGYTVDDDAQADAYERVVKLLKQKGYERYEVSNFARDNKISLHNYKYWTGANYYGFGVSAHSLVDGVRYANTDSVQGYIEGAKKTAIALTDEDKKEEKIMLAMRTARGLDLNDFASTWKDLREEKKEQLDKLCALKVVEIKDGFLRATDEGFYLLSAIITELI